MGQQAKHENGERLEDAEDEKRTIDFKARNDGAPDERSKYQGDEAKALINSGDIGIGKSQMTQKRDGQPGRHDEAQLVKQNKKKDLKRALRAEEFEERQNDRVTESAWRSDIALRLGR